MKVSSRPTKPSVSAPRRRTGRCNHNGTTTRRDFVSLCRRVVVVENERVMGLFKSKDERRIEREMKIRSGVRSIERSIRQQEKFAEDFIKNAQHARKIGDNNQYLFIRNA